MRHPVKEWEREALKQQLLGPWPHRGVYLSSQPCTGPLGATEVTTVLNENEHVQVVAAIYYSENLMGLKQ